MDTLIINFHKIWNKIIWCTDFIIERFQLNLFFNSLQQVTSTHMSWDITVNSLFKTLKHQFPESKLFYLFQMVFVFFPHTILKIQIKHTIRTSSFRTTSAGHLFLIHTCLQLNLVNYGRVDQLHQHTFLCRSYIQMPKRRKEIVSTFSSHIRKSI